MGGDAEFVGRFLGEDGDFCAGIDDPSEFVFAPGAFDMEVGKFSGASAPCLRKYSLVSAN